MERIWTSEIGSHVGERVRLAGWLHRLRRLSQVSFLILRDARGLAQIVVDDPALVEQLAGLQHESVLAVAGLVVANPPAPGGLELHAPTVEAPWVGFLLIVNTYTADLGLRVAEYRVTRPGGRA